MTIRAATVSDADAISSIWAPQILQTAVTFNSVAKSANDVADMIAQRPFFSVCEAAGKVVGFVTYDQFRGGVGYAHTMEHTIILAPSAQRKGIGRALMQAAISHGRAGGVHSFVAGLSGENAAGLAFHLRLGFKQVGVLPQAGRKFGRWMDLVLMQKRL